MTTDGLDIWTITAHPADYPNDYVARRHVVKSGGSMPTGDHYTAPTLETLQHVMRRMGLVRIPRPPDDDAVIVESWI
jgi:hypothetical protein